MLVHILDQFKALLNRIVVCIDVFYMISFYWPFYNACPQLSTYSYATVSVSVCFLITFPLSLSLFSVLLGHVFAASAACCSLLRVWGLVAGGSACWFTSYIRIHSNMAYNVNIVGSGHCSCVSGRIKTIFCSFRTFFRRFEKLLALIYL